MTPMKFSIEKTAIGLQYVIPGTERAAKPPRRVFKTDRTPAGDQFVIPGAERISMGDYLARLVEKPMMPRRRQVGLHATALFGGRGRR